MMMMMTKR